MIDVPSGSTSHLPGTAALPAIALKRGIGGLMCSELEVRDGERFPIGSWWIDEGPHKSSFHTPV